MNLKPKYDELKFLVLDFLRRIVEDFIYLQSNTLTILYKRMVKLKEEKHS